MASLIARARAIFPAMGSRIFLLSPANCSGERASFIFREDASSDLARRLRTRQGAPLGEVFAFLSGLYFRGKLVYGLTFARPPAGLSGVYVITTNRGLLMPHQPVRLPSLRRFAGVPIDASEPRYRQPLLRDARMLSRRLEPETEVVLLGSIATGKYVDILGEAFGSRLVFPKDFVGRGDMSRGGLMLRCAREGRELEYLSVQDAVRHGSRPPKLPRLARR